MVWHVHLDALMCLLKSSELVREDPGNSSRPAFRSWVDCTYVPESASYAIQLVTKVTVKKALACSPRTLNSCSFAFSV